MPFNSPVWGGWDWKTINIGLSIDGFIISQSWQDEKLIDWNYSGSPQNERAG
jgi:hypothetical protein